MIAALGENFLDPIFLAKIAFAQDSMSIPFSAANRSAFSRSRLRNGSANLG
jgi:hypothetical protein